jgi:copper resistance protein D
LIPLYLLCCSHGGSAEIERRDLSRVMEDFGKAGWGFITAMLVSGGYLLFGLLDAPADLWTSAYGRLLSAKLILVATLMATGTCNKFRLVPALRDPALFPANLVRLRRSIQMEMGLAAVVLLLAATFTTVFGPAS